MSERPEASKKTDLRDTSAIVREASRSLDFGAPVALLLLRKE
jgi:hypothetical protein